MELDPGNKYETHYTCTSTPLDGTPGSKPEYILKEIVDQEYLQTHGHPVSSDGAAAIIQREQAIRASKRKP